jgi:hypothetical protein
VVEVLKLVVSQVQVHLVLIVLYQHLDLQQLHLQEVEVVLHNLIILENLVVLVEEVQEQIVVLVVLVQLIKVLMVVVVSQVQLMLEVVEVVLVVLGKVHHMRLEMV